MLSTISTVISAIFACAHSATGLVALLFEKDLLFNILLDTDKFEPSNLLPEKSWKKFLRCARLRDSRGGRVG